MPSKRRSERVSLLLRTAIALGSAVFLVACTATQRGWCHDNLPLFGSLFDPLVPPPALPLWHQALAFLASLFEQHPAVAGTSLAGVAAVVHERVNGFPGSRRAADIKATRVQKRHVRQATSKHLAALDARKAAETRFREAQDAQKRAEAAKAAAEQKAADAAKAATIAPAAVTG